MKAAPKPKKVSNAYTLFQDALKKIGAPAINPGLDYAPEVGRNVCPQCMTRRAGIKNARHLKPLPHTFHEQCNARPAAQEA